MSDTQIITDDEVLPDAEITSIFDLFSTDRIAEEDGKWFLNYFGDRAPGNDIKLRGFNSKVSLTVRRRLEAQYRHQVKTDGTFPLDVAQKILTLQLAEAIVIDFRGPIFQDRDGTPLKCDPATVLRLLTAMPALRNMLSGTASSTDQFRAAAQEDATKN